MTSPVSASCSCEGTERDFPQLRFCKTGGILETTHFFFFYYSYSVKGLHSGWASWSDLKGLIAANAGVLYGWVLPPWSLLIPWMFGSMREDVWWNEVATPSYGARHNISASQLCHSMWSGASPETWLQFLCLQMVVDDQPLWAVQCNAMSSKCFGHSEFSMMWIFKVMCLEITLLIQISHLELTPQLLLMLYRDDLISC